MSNQAIRNQRTLAKCQAAYDNRSDSKYEDDDDSECIDEEDPDYPEISEAKKGGVWTGITGISIWSFIAALNLLIQHI
jgi:hypothetical protein